MLCSSSTGAADAGRNRRIEAQPLLRDLLAALEAISITAVIKALQRGRDAPQLLLPLPLGSQRHRLALHGVHARESPV